MKVKILMLLMLVLLISCGSKNESIPQIGVMQDGTILASLNGKIYYVRDNTLYKKNVSVDHLEFTKEGVLCSRGNKIFRLSLTKLS